MKQTNKHAAPRARHSGAETAEKSTSSGRGKLALKIVCVVLTGVLGLACIGGATGLGLGRGLLGLIHVDSGTSSAPLVFNTSDVVEQPNSHVDLSTLSVRGNTENITNILLIGVDNRGGETYGRSDTNMILSINHSSKTIKLISLMRDTWVTIPGLDNNGDGRDDYAKLNAAYSNGGFELLRATMKQNYCLDIPQYATVDFEAFRVGIDTLGGIDVELDDRVVSWIPKIDPGDPDSFAKSFEGDQLLEPIGYTAGSYHLEGFQALAYCRVRYAYADSDYSRQSNQRVVVGKLLEKVKTSNPITLFNMMSKVLPYVTTNVSQNEMEHYVVNIFDYMDYTIETSYYAPTAEEFSILTLGSSEGLWIDDPTAVVSALHQYIYG